MGTCTGREGHQAKRPQCFNASSNALFSGRTFHAVPSSTSMCSPHMASSC